MAERDMAVCVLDILSKSRTVQPLYKASAECWHSRDF